MTMPPSKKSEVEKRVFLRPNIKESFEELNENEVVHVVDLAIREIVEELSGCLFNVVRVNQLSEYSHWVGVGYVVCYLFYFILSKSIHFNQMHI